MEERRRREEAGAAPPRSTFPSVLTQSGPGYWAGRVGDAVGWVFAGNTRSRRWNPSTPPDNPDPGLRPDTFDAANPENDELTNPNAPQRPR
jgi:hypothetical protein